MRTRHRLLLALLVASFVTAVLIGIASARLVGSAVQERFEERLRAECALLGSWVSDLEPDRLHGFAVASGGRLGYRVSLIDGGGVVVGDSAQDVPGLERMDNHSDRPEIRQAMLEGSGSSRRTSRTTSLAYFYYAQRVQSATNDVAVVRIALPASVVQQARREYAWIIGIVSFLALAVLSVVSYSVFRRLSKPVEKLTAASIRVAAGERDLELGRLGDDDFGRLSEAVGRMRDSLGSQIRELEAERRLLATVVSGIREGLLLVDGDLRVKLANESFRKVFGVSFDPVGRLLPEVVRDPGVIGHLERSAASGEEIRDRVIRAPQTGRSFEMRATPLPGKGDESARGVLALFFDITRLEALEGVRQEFVANVSHELRTPLTSIRAAVESLVDGAVDDGPNRERFLRIVQRHSGHMGELIDDLTDLSRIETGAVQLERTPVRLRDLALEVIEQIRTRYPSSEVDVAVDVEDDFTVLADPLRLEQILVNLIDNAVKFTRNGGEVRVVGRSDRDRAVVEIRDTGEGIPSESLDRIFNRFYRVDKARSKEVPGTGLGLSIVKHLMRLHGGSVRVESEYGRGSTFFLEFPVAPTAGSDSTPEPA